MSKMITQQIQKTIDSREVAEMVDKRHTDLIRDIDNYISAISENADLRSQDFFNKTSYKTLGNNKTYKRYDVTLKGCEMIAHKMTGTKGVQFTAAYINRFHEMEDNIPMLDSGDELKNKRLEIMEKNSNQRQANLLLKIAAGYKGAYKQVLESEAVEIVTGKRLLPLPITERKTYSASEIGERCNCSANKIGRLANAAGLKTDEYGRLFVDKSRYSQKEVESFRYYEEAIPVFEKLIAGEIGTTEQNIEPSTK